MALMSTPGSPRYSTAVMGDGRILPIQETMGHRITREIDPMSVEGRELLDAGLVTLWFEDGARVMTAPIQKVLEIIQSGVQQRRQDYPGMPRWTAHHDEMLQRIGRVRRTLKSRH